MQLLWTWGLPAHLAMWLVSLDNFSRLPNTMAKMAFIQWPPGKDRWAAWSGKRKPRAESDSEPQFLNITVEEDVLGDKYLGTSHRGLGITSGEFSAYIPWITRSNYKGGIHQWLELMKESNILFRVVLSHFLPSMTTFSYSFVHL